MKTKIVLDAEFYLKFELAYIFYKLKGAYEIIMTY